MVAQPLYDRLVAAVVVAELTLAIQLNPIPKLAGQYLRAKNARKANYEKVIVQASPAELALLNLKGSISPSVYGYLDKEEAYEMLKELSGETFPIDDIEAWTEWVRQEMEGYPSRFSPDC